MSTDASISAVCQPSCQRLRPVQRSAARSGEQVRPINSSSPKPLQGRAALLMSTAGPGPSSRGSLSTVRARLGALWSRASGAWRHRRKTGALPANLAVKWCHCLHALCGWFPLAFPQPSGSLCSARNKRIAGIKSLDLYALALFVDPGSVRSALRARFGGADATTLARDQRLFDGAPRCRAAALRALRCV